MCGAIQRAPGCQVHQAVVEVEEEEVEEVLTAERALVEEVEDILLQEEGEERGHLSEAEKGDEETVEVVDGEEEEEGEIVEVVGEGVAEVEGEEDQVEVEVGVTAQVADPTRAPSEPGKGRITLLRHTHNQHQHLLPHL